MTFKDLQFANRIAVGLATVVLVGVMVGPSASIEQGLGLNDVAAHALAFYLLSLAAFAVAPAWRRNDLAVGVFALGALIEFVQAATGGTGSFADLAADAAGVLGAVLPSLVERLRHLTRTRPYASISDLARLDRRRHPTSFSASHRSRTDRRDALRKEP